MSLSDILEMSAWAALRSMLCFWWGVREGVGFGFLVFWVSGGGGGLGWRLVVGEEWEERMEVRRYWWVVVVRD